MNEYFSKWSIKRVIQLAVGLFFIVYYFKDNSIIALLFGILMSVQALANVGCFSTKGCTTPTDNSSNPEEFSGKIKEITPKK